MLSKILVGDTMKITLMLLMVGMISCAQQEIKLSGDDRPYGSSNEVTPVRMATKNIQIAEVTDAREKTDIGVARTGLQYRETPVRLNQEFTQFMREYFTDAFYKRNIMVESEAEIVLSIVVNQLWLSEVLNNNEAAKCEVNLSLSANEGKRSWKGNVWTEYVSKGDLSDGTDKLGPTLATCLNNAVEKLVKDKAFVTFLKK